MAHTLYTGTDWIAGSFSPSGLPVSTDEIVIPDTVADTKTDTLGNANDIDLALLMVDKGNDGEFGADGSPIQTAASLVIHQGNGGFYFEATDDAATPITTDEVRIEAGSPSTLAKLSSDSGAHADGGDYTKIIVSRGTVTLDSSIDFDASAKVIVSTMGGPNDANLTITAGAPTLPEFEQSSGISTLHNVVTDLRVIGGVCYKETALATNVCVFPGATLVWNHASLAVDNTFIEVLPGGVLDLTQNSVDKVIDQVIRYPGGIVRYDKNLHDIQTYVEHVP